MSKRVECLVLFKQFRNSLKTTPKGLKITVVVRDFFNLKYESAFFLSTLSYQFWRIKLLTKTATIILRAPTRAPFMINELKVVYLYIFLKFVLYEDSWRNLKSLYYIIRDWQSRGREFESHLLHKGNCSNAVLFLFKYAHLDVHLLAIFTIFGYGYHSKNRFKC